MSMSIVQQGMCLVFKSIVHVYSKVFIRGYTEVYKYSVDVYTSIEHNLYEILTNNTHTYIYI